MKFLRIPQKVHLFYQPRKVGREADNWKMNWEELEKP